MATQVTSSDIRHAIRDLNLEGKPLCVHSSLRSFGRVEGGPATVVDALLAEGCTVLVPAFSAYFLVAPPENLRPARNDWDYSVNWALPHKTRMVFTPRSNIVDDDMGAVPKSILSRQGRERGNHPMNSFAAVGPLARMLVSGQRPEDVYAPLRALIDYDGYVVLMGVGLDRMTALHLAESMAGRTLFRRWALDPDGEPMMVEIGSCSNGFPNLDRVLAPVERRRDVGQSTWRIFAAREAIDLAAETMRQNPEITHCDDPDCGRCRDSIAGGPILP